MENGGAFHQYQPLTKRGNDAVGTNFNDDPLWLVLSVAAYLKETGDKSLLDECVPYNNVPGSEQPLYDHLQKCLQYTLERLGPHALPLIGRADWNDCLNLNCFSDTPGESFQTTTTKDGRVAESVLIAGLFVWAAKEMSGLAAWKGLENEAAKYHAAAEQMAKVVREHGWDGKWFLRAYDDSSSKVGSHEREEGQIYIEPQGLCVIAGLGREDGRAEQALASVRERLATPHGIMLLQPAYTRYHLHLGEISSYPPGYKENAGIFCHTNPWIMMAEAVLGHGDQAYEYYRRINPSVREAVSDLHRCEPYVYAQLIAGRDAPTYGEAKNSWLTGTAAWSFVAITQWILGIRPQFDGLEIAPVIPTGWSGYQATRIYRGVTYRISVKRKGDGNAVSLAVDGEPIKGTLVPLPSPKKRRVAVDVVVR
jgi:cellobiose phosphorylase